MKDYEYKPRPSEPKKFCYKIQHANGKVESGDGMHVNKNTFKKLLGKKNPRVPFDRILVWDPAKEKEPFA